MNKHGFDLNLDRRNFLYGSGAVALGTMAPSLLAAQGVDRRLATSSKGVVTSPHELATAAGLEILKSGGNAIEAAIAIGACLNVTYPHFSGFGGDAFMIISDRNGKVRTLSGIGQAPALLPNYSGSIPLRGPQSMLTTAAGVDTLGRAFDISRQELAGSKSWGDLLKPAIGMARGGFPVTPSEKFWMDFRAADLKDLPAITQQFMIDGKMPEVGQLFRQTRLADTLETLAVRGYRDFYEGRVAEQIAKGLKSAGSPLTAADLAATRARVEPPLRVAYRDGVLLANQPPTQGITTLEIMGILDRFDLQKVAEGSAEYYHLLVEAVKLAFIDRNRFVADPEFSDVPTARLLSKAHLDKLAGAVDMKRALAWPHVFKQADTVYIGATDAAGNSISMLQTVYFDWGSGVMAGDTGILWHNRGASFNLTPGHHNALRAGKRPFHTLNPGMYLKDDKPHILYGTQGADGQPQTLATVLTRMIDYRMDPLTSLTRPRFLLGKTFSDSRDSLKLEKDAGEAVFQQLAAKGHEMSVIAAQSPLAGHPGAIVIDTKTGVASGAHDPRSDGRALGV